MLNGIKSAALSGLATIIIGCSATPRSVKVEPEIVVRQETTPEYCQSLDRNEILREIYTKVQNKGKEHQNGNCPVYGVVGRLDKRTYLSIFTPDMNDNECRTLFPKFHQGLSIGYHDTHHQRLFLFVYNYLNQEPHVFIDPLFNGKFPLPCNVFYNPQSCTKLADKPLHLMLQQACVISHNESK